MRCRFGLIVSLFVGLVPAARGEDVAIYGGTSAGVAAAIQAVRMGKSVLLIEPGKHLGGLTTGGLGWTDSGNKAVVGGIAREFYQRVKAWYDQPNSWKYEKREQYRLYRKDEDAMWTFEPHAAEAILRVMISDHRDRIVIHYGERLDRTPGKGVELDGKRIVSVRMESGTRFTGRVFIDATYEGDLMAAAGVSYTVGREANAKYGETLDGVARKWNQHNHRFTAKVDPFVKRGDKSSGLLPGIDPGPLPADGEGDDRLQAYCFRLCMSNVPANRVPFPKPADYDEKRYELLLRNFEAGDLRFPMKPDMMPNGKTDTNNNGAFSTDCIGANYKYPEASYAERDKVIADHESYQKGFMWTLANHPRVATRVRAEMALWGLAKDEFLSTGNWPHQIYVREARRMIGDYVATEKDCRRLVDTPESVGMGSYNMDSHNCCRYVTPEGSVQNEGDVQVSPGGPYRISYRSLVPKKGECPNLLVPVCLSSSHIAYGSIRMEPVFFVLGQSAATAAVLAIDANCALQMVDYAKLRARLLADKQVLEFAAPPSPGAIDPKKLPGIVVDDEAAERTGFDAVSTAIGPYVGTGYRHDGGKGDGKQSAKFVPDLPAAGKYEIRLAYTANPNRATNAKVVIVHAGGTKEVTLNQRKAPTIDKAWVSLRTYMFEKGKAGSVTVSNSGADGYVIIDAVQWLPLKE
jgi:hypothetical protein